MSTRPRQFIRNHNGKADEEDRPMRAGGGEDRPEAPRREVLEALDESLLQYYELYRKLAQ